MDDTTTARFDALLAPLQEQRDGLVDEITQLQARVEALRAELLKIDRVLKAAGLMEKARGPSRLNSRPRSRSSAPSTMSRPTVGAPAVDAVVEFVTKRGTATIADVVHGLNMPETQAQKAMRVARIDERLRLVGRTEKQGRGHARMIFGPWNDAGGDA